MVKKDTADTVYTNYRRRAVKGETRDTVVNYTLVRHSTLGPPYSKLGYGILNLNLDYKTGRAR